MTKGADFFHERQKPVLFPKTVPSLMIGLSVNGFPMRLYRVKSELANSHLTFTVKKMTIQRKEMVKIMNLFQWL